MANYNASNAQFSWNGTPLTAQPIGPLNVNVAGEVEDITPYGVTAQVQGYAGLQKTPDIKLAVLYDDTASTGSDALFNNVGSTGTLKVGLGGTKTYQQSAVIKGYERVITIGKFTKANVTFALSGARTEV